MTDSSATVLVRIEELGAKVQDRRGNNHRFTRMNIIGNVCEMFDVEHVFVIYHGEGQ